MLMTVLRGELVNKNCPIFTLIFVKIWHIFTFDFVKCIWRNRSVFNVFDKLMSDFNMSLVFVKLESNAILIIHANRLTKGFLQEIRDSR
ncbi:hypothetical protein BFS05_03655 [Gardnerella vaginalis]|uniref:Uncharacterized protein n=1 Tax=Gardnerella vaginalis TaxID=2702 RepID=A0A2K1SUH6_GARVA|nr:hypothetical protein BFS05_03655 [Gardnerella vaginalis]